MASTAKLCGSVLCECCLHNPLLALLPYLLRVVRAAVSEVQDGHVSYESYLSCAQGLDRVLHDPRTGLPLALEGLLLLRKNTDPMQTRQSWALPSAAFLLFSAYIELCYQLQTMEAATSGREGRRRRRCGYCSDYFSNDMSLP